jgi:hypothetical protein
MKTIVVVFAAFVLAGCECENENITTPDQCARREIFKECLAGVPKGPSSTGLSSDWDEVVNVCGQQAYYLALRKKDQIKAECRG